MESRLGNETVILHLGNGTYFGLDPVGTVIWEELIGAGGTLADLGRAVARAFPDAPETLGRDVEAFLLQLARHDLLRTG